MIVDLHVNKDNEIGIGSLKSYCMLCVHKQIKSDENLDEPYSVRNMMAIDKYQGKNRGEQVLNLRIGTTKATICKDCIKEINSQMNPCTCKKEAAKEEVKEEVQETEAKTEETAEKKKAASKKKGGK